MDIQSTAFNELFVLYPLIIQGWVTPVKPDGIAHGGIPKALYDDQTQGLECLIDPWTELQLQSWTMAVDDRVDLYINNDATPVTGKTVASGEENQRMRLYIPHRRLIQGVNRLHYKVTRPGGNVEDSRDLLVLYNRLIPETLDLVIPPDVITDGVSAERAARGVEFGFIWSNRRPFDLVRFQLGDETIQWEVPDAPAPVVRKLFTDTFLKVGDDPNTPADFIVFDQLGNFAQSPTKRLDVHLDRLDLPAPTVKGMTGNNFSPTQPEVRVLVPQGSLLPGDKLTVIWKGATAVAAGSYTSPQRLVSAGLEIAVPRSVLAYSLGKAVTVTYVIERNGTSSTSLPLTLNILVLPATALIAPVIVEADANNVLDVSALGTRNATLHALLWTLIDAGQPCWMSLEGKKANGTAHNLSLWNGLPAQVNTTWVTQGFWPHNVANSYLKELGSGTTLTVKFKASLDKSNVEATAVVFPDRQYTIKAVEDVKPAITTIKISASGADIPNGGLIVATSVVLTGTASKGEKVEVFDGTVSKGQPSADPTTGIWTLTVSGLAVAAHRFTAKALYGSGQVSAVRTLTVVAVMVPTLTNVQDASGKEIPEAGTTTSTTLKLTGKASNGQRVEIYDGSGSSAVSKGIATADPTTGVWERTITVAVGGRRLYAKSLYHSSHIYSNVRLLTVVAAVAPTIDSVKGSPGNFDIPNGGLIVATSVLLTGTASRGEKVEVFDGTVSKGQPSADPTTGIWTLTVSGLAVAAHRFTAKALYGSGQVSAVRTLTVVAVMVPTLTNVKDASGKEIPEAGTTTSTTLKLTGKASNGQRVEIYEGTGTGKVPMGEATADPTTGVWERTITVAVGARRLYALSLYHRDTVYSNVRLLTVVATVAPTITTVKGSPSNDEIADGSNTIETSVVLTGTASRGEKVEVFDGTVSKGQPSTDPTTGIWTLTVSGLAVAAHRFTAKALYSSGQVSAARTLTVVAVMVPTLTSVQDASGKEIPEAGTTPSTTLKLTGKASNGKQVEIYEGSYSTAVSKGVATAHATTGVWERTITVAVGGRRLYAKSLYHSSHIYSNVRLLTVGEPISIGQDPMILDGVKLLQDFGWSTREVPGNTATRVPTAGIAPYTYTSQNPTVATVNASGMVRGLKNGETTIIVGNATGGATASYKVSVSNIYRVLKNDTYLYAPEVQAWLTSVGAINDSHPVMGGIAAVPAFTANFTNHEQIVPFNPPVLRDSYRIVATANMFPPPFPLSGIGLVISDSSRQLTFQWDLGMPNFDPTHGRNRAYALVPENAS
ncbi:Ig-like domain-containing protein [Pseudomonas sp. C9]|nr:Ig-like domain-containing protein [Pseudomonas sp. C9]OOG11112.1 hypothetical protein BMS17_03060 [Pseudomonas sp. C9]